VRKAMNMAVNEDAIVSRIMRGQATPAGHLISPGIPGYDKTLDQRLPFDPDGAKKLLAEAVWYSPANKKVKLDAQYDAKLLTTPAKVATLIQPDWKWYNARKEDIDARVTKMLKG